MSIHQQLCSLQCSVASLLRGVTDHCLASQSHCPDIVDDIQTVRKSSTDQCISSGQVMFSVHQ